MIELRTLGEVDLLVDGQPAKTLIAHPKRLAVLIFLIVSDATMHRRDTLLSLFWPELDEARARAALRKALHFIRREVGEHVLVNRGDDAVVVDRTGVRCDATALRVAAANAEHDVVLRLYRGEFLAGFHVDNAPDFDRWLENARKGFKALTYTAARSMAKTLENAGDTEGASDAMKSAQHMEPFNAKLVKETVAIMTRSGQSVRAIRIFDEMAERFLLELGDRDAAIHAYEESLRMREELETQLRSEKEVLHLRITSLRSQVLTA